VRNPAHDHRRRPPARSRHVGPHRRRRAPRPRPARDRPAAPLARGAVRGRGPASAETLAAGGDLASVYRNLEIFEAVGLVRHVHLGHGPGRYALRGRGGWAACEACGRHERLPAAALARLRLLVREETGLDSDFDHFPIVGLCPECANVP